MKDSWCLTLRSKPSRDWPGGTTPGSQPGDHYHQRANSNNHSPTPFLWDYMRCSLGRDNKQKQSMSTSAARLLSRQGLCVWSSSQPTVLHILVNEFLVFPLHPAPKSGKNYQAKTISLIMWELLLSPSSQHLDFLDYFLRLLFDKSAQATLSLTFFPLL